MRHNRTSSEGKPPSRARRRWWLAAAAAGALLPALAGAQAPVVMQVKSALHTLLAGQSLIVTVAEVGDTAEASWVSIEIRDVADNVRASVSRDVARARPLRLGTTVTTAPREPLRAIVTVTIPSSSEVHEPIVSLEAIDSTNLTIRTLPPCPVPIEQMPSGGGGAIGNCDGWHQAFLSSAPNGGR